LRGVSEVFVAQLDEQELAVLKSALDKVTVDCTFGREPGRCPLMVTARRKTDSVV